MPTKGGRTGNGRAAQPAPGNEVQREVLPIPDITHAGPTTYDAKDPELAGRPILIRGASQTLYPGMGRLDESCLLNLLDKSHVITAEVVIARNGVTGGVIVNQGGGSGGWALYLEEGRPTYVYNFVGLETYRISAPAPLADGRHELRLEFAYDGGGLGKGGTATLLVDGRAVGTVKIMRTHMMSFSLTETLDVGRDTGSPVTDDYLAERNTFPGTINWVRIDLGNDSHDHLIDPSAKLELAMTRQ